MTAPLHPAVADWAVASRSLEPWDECGDLHVVAPFDGGALVAAVDGLGHGAEAAVAARTAAAVLAENASTDPVELMQLCHEALRRTRGAVVSIASLDALTSTMTWLAVGNVEAMLLREDTTSRPPREVVLNRGGLVGYQLPTLRASTVSIGTNDLLVFATDGVDQRFMLDVRVVDDLQHMADAMLATHAKGTDDALVLLVRYLGGAA